MKHEFHPEALFELEAAADYYANCQKGLEIRFIDAVYSAINRACSAPERWQLSMAIFGACLFMFSPMLSFIRARMILFTSSL